MTINSEWVKIWKTCCPKSFTSEPKFKPTVYFIDGQIKLMKSAYIRTWEQFLEYQFCNVIRKAFNSGCNVVVLAFDNYEHVPSAKGMTQAKRNKTKVDFEFNMHQSLPSQIPENWESAIRNRVFKSKVIDYVKTFVPQCINLTESQKLIIDHQGHPIMHLSGQKYREMEEIHPKGECDVKFTSYASMGAMLIDAIDGDYIPMAMLYLENYKRLNNREPHSIAIYRMLCNNVPKGEQKPLDKTFKRRREDDEGEDDSESFHMLKAKKNYEYLYVNELYSRLSKMIQYCDRDVQNPALVLASLAAMTGCDYTQGLPTLGPTRIWKMKHLIIPALAASEEKQLIKASINLYCTQYEKQLLKCPEKLMVQHSSSSSPVYDPMLTLKSSPIMADSTKKQIPTLEYIACHCRNILWTLKYWEAGDTYPNPILPEHGYKRNLRTGAPEYCVTMKDSAFPVQS